MDHGWYAPGAVWLPWRAVLPQNRSWGKVVRIRGSMVTLMGCLAPTTGKLSTYYVVGLYPQRLTNCGSNFNLEGASEGDWIRIYYYWSRNIYMLNYCTNEIEIIIEVGIFTCWIIELNWLNWSYYYWSRNIYKLNYLQSYENVLFTKFTKRFVYKVTYVDISLVCFDLVCCDSDPLTLLTPHEGVLCLPWIRTTPVLCVCALLPSILHVFDFSFCWANQVRADWFLGLRPPLL